MSRLSVARKEREILLEQRRNEVKNSLVLQEWIKKREESKIALALELRGDLTKEEERFLREQVTAKLYEIVVNLGQIGGDTED